VIGKKPYKRVWRKHLVDLVVLSVIISFQGISESKLQKMVRDLKQTQRGDSYRYNISEKIKNYF